MNTHRILTATAHRPYPAPTSPWVMRQAWNNLLFAHWPLSPEALRPHVPAALPLDTFDGSAWIGIVPFTMSDVSARGLPALPGLSTFPELNVRTYVTVNGQPGVYFFSLDATNALAVWGARLAFHLPYVRAHMHVRREGATILYDSRRAQTHRRATAELAIRYRPVAPATTPQPCTLEYFLTERYCLYTMVRNQVHRCEIQHPAWPLQVAEAEIARNSMACAAGITLPHVPPLLHYAERQEVVTWPLRRVASE